jgi:hypothetical protein
MLTPGQARAYLQVIGKTPSPLFPEKKQTKDKTMTYNYRLRSAVASVFASAFTVMFAVTALTGNALPLA